MPRTVHLVAAARPNFMKIAPLYEAFKADPELEPLIVHTGQHYDLNMSGVFFDDFGLPQSCISLGAGSGSHARQTAKVMVAYEDLLLEAPPELVVVPGDVNSTAACTLAAVKLGLPVAHLEAGLRSFDRTMPEEINRVVTDALADLLWTPSPDADENLRREGAAPERIQRVGNIMIDTLVRMLPQVEACPRRAELGLEPGRYAVVTLHRPFNVDNPANLRKARDGLIELSRRLPVVFPVHPRTAKNLGAMGLGQGLEDAPGVILSPPLGYIEFMNLILGSAMAISDSGGIQEETTWLGIPCLTLRPNTERPITVSQGTNRLCGLDDFVGLAMGILDSPRRPRPVIELWDGRTARRITERARAFLAARA